MPRLSAKERTASKMMNRSPMPTLSHVSSGELAPVMMLGRSMAQCERDWVKGRMGREDMAQMSL